MLRVGITGGIGAGKTTVCGEFESLGVPVYYADSRAKLLMTSSDELIAAVKARFGEKSYDNNSLNRAYLAEIVFNDKSALEDLNQIVHPVVERDFQNWMSRQDAPYVLQELAILFEKNAQDRFDYTILVTAPEDLRIQRVMLRDNVSEEQVKARINNQWTQQRKEKLADFVLPCIEIHHDREKIKKIHEHLITLA